MRGLAVLLAAEFLHEHGEVVGNDCFDFGVGPRGACGWFGHLVNEYAICMARIAAYSQVSAGRPVPRHAPRRGASPATGRSKRRSSSGGSVQSAAATGRQRRQARKPLQRPPCASMSLPPLSSWPALQTFPDAHNSIAARRSHTDWCAASSCQTTSVIPSHRTDFSTARCRGSGR